MEDQQVRRAKQEIVKNAIQAGNLSLLNFLKIDNKEAQCCFLFSVEANNVLITQHLLQNFEVKIDDYAIIAAVEQNNLEMVKLLCSHGCVTTAYDNGALRLAIKRNRVEIVTYLKGLGINFNNIKYAIQNTTLDVIRLLFDDTQILDPAALRVACENNKLDVLKYLITFHELGIEDTLFHAASNNKLDIVKFVIGIDKTYVDEAFIIAIQKGYVEISELLKPFASAESKDVIL
jgi:hypothetical protein